MAEQRDWILALDPGSGSLGSAAYYLNDGSLAELIGASTWIFPTGRNPDNTTNASGRTSVRQRMRHGRRKKQDRRHLDSILHRLGLIPGPEGWKEFCESIDPIKARVEASSGSASKYVVGRALRDLYQNRGYAVTRSLDRVSSEDKKDKKITEAEQENTKTSIAKAALSEKVSRSTGDNNKPLSHFLLEMQKRGRSRRFRKGTGADPNLYEYFPTREMFEREIEVIRECNAKLISKNDWNEIVQFMKFQRPLKRPMPGKCTFNPTEDRLPRWDPAAIEFRILDELSRIRMIDSSGEETSLDVETRDVIYRHLMSGRNMSWKKFRKTLKLADDVVVNLKDSLTELKGNQVVAKFRGARNTGPLAAVWDDFAHQLDKILSILDGRDPDDPNADPTDSVEVVVERLIALGMSEDTARAVEKVPLLKGRSRLGRTATNAVINVWRSENCRFHEAMEIATGTSHSNFSGEMNLDFKYLPPYNRLAVIQKSLNGTGNAEDPDEKRLGVVNNPTVHVWLGQVQKVVNDWIARVGCRPATIVLELPRDITRSTEELNALITRQRKNREKNEKRRELLASINADETPTNMFKLRLWEELPMIGGIRVDVFEGKPVSVEGALSMEVEHILPYSRTLDNGVSNKTLAWPGANAEKTDHPLGEGKIWGSDKLREIIDRVHAAPEMKYKAWRFYPDAMERFEDLRTFEERQLAETGWIASLMRCYLESLFPNDGNRHVLLPRGWMTSYIRSEFKLFLPGKERKDRDDFRHHTLDAIALAVLGQKGIIPAMFKMEKRRINARKDRNRPRLPEPYKGFGDEARAFVATSLTGHRANHNVTGALTEDSIYGNVRDIPDNAGDRKRGNLVIRKPVVALTAKEVRNIRYKPHRIALLAINDLPASQRNEALLKWSRKQSVRSVRILKPYQTARAVSGLRTGEGPRLLVPGVGVYVDIFEAENGSWVGKGVNIMDFAKAEPIKGLHPDPAFRMRVYKGDLLQFFEEAGDGAKRNRVYRVTSLRMKAKDLRLVDVNDADVSRNHHVGFNGLRDRRARRVWIDRTGRLRTVPIGKV